MDSVKEDAEGITESVKQGSERKRGTGRREGDRPSPTGRARAGTGHRHHSSNDTRNISNSDETDTDKQEAEEASNLPATYSYVTLSAEEKEWLVVSATADYHAMYRLLTTHGHLATLRDISNGYTALHWASKLGQPEVVKLLANRIGVNVNQQSHGGYTPMHLAAMQGHTQIMDLLLNVYKADPNIRDHSGRRARRYLNHPEAPHVPDNLPYLSYSTGDWHIILSPATQVPRSSISSRSGSVCSMGGDLGINVAYSTFPVEEGVDIAASGHDEDEDGWLLIS